MRALPQLQITFLVFYCLGLVGAAPPSESNRAECGPPSFACSRSDDKVTQPDAVPVPNFGGLRGAGSVFHDPLFNDVEIVRCTDAFSNPAHPNASYSAGLGGAGDKNSWNTEDTLLQVNATSGIPLMFRFDPKNKSCRPVCADGGDDLHCSGRGLYIPRPGVFSRVDGYKYFAFPSGISPGTKIAEIMLRPGTPPSQPNTVADFAPALYKGSNPDWKAKTRVELGDVIQPKHNNDAGLELFQAVVAGETGNEQPSWSDSVEPYRSRNHTSLPLPAWPGLLPESLAQLLVLALSHGRSRAGRQPSLRRLWLLNLDLSGWWVLA